MSENSYTDSFINHINTHILPFIDYSELQQSYETDMVYAKGILNRLHEAMVKFYGSDCLDDDVSDDGFVVIPGVVCSKESGKLGIALLTLDLSSSGEHWGTDFLCQYGVISQDLSSASKIANNADVLMSEAKKVISSYLPYDYAYTAAIPDDIHIDTERLPEAIKSVLEDFRNHHAELLFEEDAVLGDKSADADAITNGDFNTRLGNMQDYVTVEALKAGNPAREDNLYTLTRGEIHSKFGRDLTDEDIRETVFERPEVFSAEWQGAELRVVPEDYYLKRHHKRAAESQKAESLPDPTAKGYLIASTDDSDNIVPNALHIQRDDSMAIYPNDEAAAEAAEADGIKLIYGMPEIPDGVYLDTPENRAIIEKHFDTRDELLTQIAKKHCHVETLETRKRDSLDFHDVSVWGLKSALEEAYNAGIAYQIARSGLSEHSSEKSAATVREHTADAGDKTSVMAQIRQHAQEQRNRPPSSKNTPGHGKSDPEH